ncbi:MAG: hypothetical protein OXH75_16455 [Acidobacteria bacterium]|nr:hypothetical protein [Acidobacteriota bacterium]
MAVLAFLVPGSGWAQRLWTVEDVSLRPDMSPSIRSVTAGLSRVRDAEPAAGALTSVSVEFDYLRLGFGYLELPLADGSLIVAENAAFADRGGGNVMWAGRVPGAGYESVLFTVHEGHLVGWFGKPGGLNYLIHAGPDGRGTLAVETGPTGHWCGAAKRVRRGASRGPRTVLQPDAVVSRSGSDTLDVLLLYESGMEPYWRPIGGLAVGVQQLEDTLNMVFRNGAIRQAAKLTPAPYEPAALNHPAAQGQHRRSSGDSSWVYEYESSAEVERLRVRHSPDIVYFLMGTLIEGIGSGAADLMDELTPLLRFGWSYPGPLLVAHEIGHTLGGNHEPASFGTAFAEVVGGHVRPYAFGHTDLTSCSTGCPHTVMSLGIEAELAGRLAVRKPFYSSVRHRPNGWIIGVADEREVERVFQETVPISLRNSEAPYRAEQVPRRIEARWTARDQVRVTWQERLKPDWLESWNPLSVRLALVGGGNSVFDIVGGDPDDADGNVKPIVEDGALVAAEIAGLRPAGAYVISALGPWRLDAGDRWVRSLASDSIELSPPRIGRGSPSPPRRVAARATGRDSVHLSWRSESPVGGGFEIWYREWSDEGPDEVWRLYREPMPPAARSAEIKGLAVRNEIEIVASHRDGENRWSDGEKARIGRYSFVVVAYNERGFRASETFDYEFMPGPHPAPTRTGEIPACAGRESGLELNGYLVAVCAETPGGERRRAWNYGLEADQSGLLYFFDRDNVEMLVKILDGCGINGHRWVFVAPVTTLGFRLTITELGPYRESQVYRGGYRKWLYDTERRHQNEIRSRVAQAVSDDQGTAPLVGNPQGRTAGTVSDTTAFPCTPAEITSARVEAARNRTGGADLPQSDASPATTPGALRAGARSDCAPDGTALTLSGGYRISMCYETDRGETGDAQDWGLDSSQSGLLYFFDRDNVEVLVKVLDGCAVNGHWWVFVAPVTTLAFNLHVESPNGRRWSYTNRLGQTAESANDVAAFPCGVDLRKRAAKRRDR